MNILFIGYAVDKKSAETLSGSSIAGNKMQINIIKGLTKNKKINLNSITILPLASFPIEKKIYVERNQLLLFENFNSIQVPYFNLPVIKQIHQTISVYNTAKKFIEKDTVVFGFNLFPQVGLPLMWLKKKYKCKTVAMLADLPIDDRNKRNKLSKLLRAVFDYLTIRSIQNCDKLVVLNKNAAQIYAPGKEYIVVEGGVDLDEFPIEYKNIIKSSKNIIYSGALTEYSGIKHMVHAMKYLDRNDVYLEIYGDGELKPYIEKCAKEITNVFYRGKVDNETMQQIQREAFLLVNPRLVSDPISNVTFPSKIFEYMMSGTPILTTKLSGFTDDYLEKMFVVKSNDPLIMAKKINEIINLSDEDLKSKAIEARDFILMNKTWSSQSLRIDKFIRTWK